MRLRLVSISDATGQMTQFGYDWPGDPLKLTKVTDPAGNTTEFQYDPQGHLIRSINPKGVASTFTYGPTAQDPHQPMDFMNGMTTPEGTLAFRSGETLIGPSYRRWLEVRNSANAVERLEGGAGYAYEIDPEQLPKVPEIDPAQHPLDLSSRESFYWAPGVYDPGKPNFRKASHLRWGHGPGGFSSGILLSEKAPDGPRHWYVHAGDFWGGVYSAARSSRYPLTAEGTLRIGAQIFGAKGLPGMENRLAPVCDGARKLVTRDYWADASGALHGIQRAYDPQGHLLQEAPIVP
jgi:YD repeat-containing protein